MLRIDATPYFALLLTFGLGASGCSDGEGDTDSDSSAETSSSTDTEATETEATETEATETNSTETNSTETNSTETNDTGDGDGDGTTGDGDGDFVDPRDGESYSLIDLGGVLWFGENLRYATPSGRCYNNDPANCETYGRLYSYSEALTACPDGFHLSSDADWHAVETWMGMSAADLQIDGYTSVRGTDEGARLRVGGDIGFNAPMAGYATGQGFSALNDRTYIWTSTDVGGSNVYRRRIESQTPTLWRFTNPTQDYEISVRCVED